MRLRATYAVAFVLVVPVQVMAQSTSQSPPQTPSEAYERASQPLRDFEKSAEPTIERDAQAWKEHERRVRIFAVLFKLDGWKGEQLLSLAQLYAAAGQFVSAERAYVLYLKDSKALHPTLARKGLINVLFAQEKWKDSLLLAFRWGEVYMSGSQFDLEPRRNGGNRCLPFRDNQSYSQRLL